MTVRHRHDRGDEFHIGTDHEYGVIGTISGWSGVNLHDILAALDQGLRDRGAQRLLANAILKKTIQNIPAYAWVRRFTGSAPADANQFLSAVRYGNGVWVAVGPINTMYVASDILGPWVKKDPGFVFSGIRDVDFDGTTWVVVGDQGKLFTATDPINGVWTQQFSNTTRYLNGVRFANGEWVAWGGSSGVPELIAAGSDPTSWTAQSVSPWFGSTDIREMNFGNGLWVGIGDTGTVATATVATGTWTARANIPASVVPTSLVYGAGYWVLGGFRIAGGGPVFAGGPSYTSDPTSVAWTEHAAMGVGAGSSIDFDGETFGYLGTEASSPYATRFATATDPTGAWTLQQAPGMNSSARAVLYGPGFWVAVGYTDDGINFYSAVETAFSFSPTSLYASARIKAAPVTGSFTADAVIKRNQTGSLAANSVLAKTIAGSLTANAVINAPNSLTADAVLKRAQSGSLTADAVISAGAFQGDAFQADTFG